MKKKPENIKKAIYRYDSFSNGEMLPHKQRGRLPAMGWNSWNAFGSGNTEALTRCMADKLLELGLAERGYRYVVLDDGCYRPVREKGKLANEREKFPGGFRKLADYLHDRGLKFGMYNDIGTNLCGGAQVGTCGYEKEDAATYVEWGVDFLKVDNCYYPWDNATFSHAENVRYVYAPKIKSIRLEGKNFHRVYEAAVEGRLTGNGAERDETAVWNIGTFDGTGPERTPLGVQSGELEFFPDVPEEGNYLLKVTYAAGCETGIGSWLQIAAGFGRDMVMVYDDLVPGTENTDTYRESEAISLFLQKGKNILRLMNHRRQENTLVSYAALLEGFQKADPEHEILLSLCEWGKTQPQNWGYKVGDSWRILNDITFCVGADGDYGRGAWEDDYTAAVTAQYNKAVIMDMFSGLDRGWNDPDMLMIGMNGLTETMCKTHMVMWCMMNAPLMLGLDLRRVQKGDALWRIIANKELIALDQDLLGIQAKRVFCSISREPGAYIRENHRVDILAKPLADRSMAIAFINVSSQDMEGFFEISVAEAAGLLLPGIKDREVIRFLEELAGADKFLVTDLWSGEQYGNRGGVLKEERLKACDSIVYKVRADEESDER